MPAEHVSAREVGMALRKCRSQKYGLLALGVVHYLETGERFNDDTPISPTGLYHLVSQIAGERVKQSNLRMESAAFEFEILRTGFDEVLTTVGFQPDYVEEYAKRCNGLPVRGEVAIPLPGKVYSLAERDSLGNSEASL
jgi:hypothetical protein